jgi:hypothetical protein
VSKKYPQIWDTTFMVFGANAFHLLEYE